MERVIYATDPIIIRQSVSIKPSVQGRSNASDSFSSVEMMICSVHARRNVQPLGHNPGLITALVTSLRTYKDTKQSASCFAHHIDQNLLQRRSKGDLQGSHSGSLS